MTREEAKELLPIIQAFAEGKTIECKNLFGSWAEAKCPSWANNLEYRIKPEPRYRPFKTPEECWQEMLKHQPFGWIRGKYSAVLYHIESITSDRVVCAFGNHMNFDFIIKHYEFADGTPFGVKD